MATILSNQATATFTFEGCEESRSVVSNIATTSVMDEYCLEVNKQNHQQCFSAGENVTFSIKVTNCGCRRLRDFIITDDLGAGQPGPTPLTFLAGSARLFIEGDLIDINPTDLTPLTFNVPNTLESGESFTIVYVATVNENISDEIYEIINTATASAVSGCDTSCSDRYSDCDSSVLPRCTDAIVRISKQASSSRIGCCDELEYVITIENSGLRDARNIVITDQLPEGFSVNSIRVENEDSIHDYDTTEYDVDENNFLTVPNANGTEIIVRGIEPGVNHTSVMHIRGNFNS